MNDLSHCNSSSSSSPIDLYLKDYFPSPRRTRRHHVTSLKVLSAVASTNRLQQKNLKQEKSGRNFTPICHSVTKNSKEKPVTEQEDLKRIPYHLQILYESCIELEKTNSSANFSPLKRLLRYSLKLHEKNSIST